MFSWFCVKDSCLFGYSRRECRHASVANEVAIVLFWSSAIFILFWARMVQFHWVFAGNVGIALLNIIDVVLPIVFKFSYLDVRLRYSSSAGNTALGKQ